MSWSGPQSAQEFTVAPGDAVKVLDPVVFFHVAPKKNPDGFQAQGLVGQVLSIELTDKDGSAVSLNRPVRVGFNDPKFVGHFEEEELEVVDN